VVANEAGNIGIVFDNQDAGFHGFYCSWKTVARSQLPVAETG
jgi:hypothetical protein